EKKMKETVKNIWEATKDTRQKIKEDCCFKADQGINSSDEDEATSDLRKHAGGYDWKDARDV
ncbi:hypothetical protein MKX01_037323, partial [Papaver californicum]